MSQYAQQIGTIAVDAVMAVAVSSEVDLRDVRIVKRLGGTVEEMRLLEGCVALNQPAVRLAGGPTRIEKARIAICQFSLTHHPKTDMENQVVVKDYAQMDRILREEKALAMSICRKIKKAGATVLIIQKSILRDGVSELMLHYLAKMRVMVVRDVEREDVEFLCRALGCRPIADIESFTEDKLGSAELVEEQEQEGSAASSGDSSSSTLVLVHKPTPAPKMSGMKRTVSVLVRGANALVMDEAERALHDALCVVRCLVRNPAMIVGGGAPETAISVRLAELAKRRLASLETESSSVNPGTLAFCMSAYAGALECIPTILAENAGLPAIEIMTALRAKHAEYLKKTFYNNISASADAATLFYSCYDGINVRRAEIGDMHAERVLQPLLVNSSALQLATDCVAMILKIDDMLQSR